MKYVGSVVVVIVILSLCAAVIVPSVFNNHDNGNDAQSQSYNLEPLHVRRADGRVETITLAQAMAKHHGLDAHHHHDHHDSESHEQHAGDVCLGVGVGYQAVRYAGEILFPGDTPASSDLELSAVGDMRGTWDVFEMYLGQTLTRPESKTTNMSLNDFVFTAKRPSTGKTITFRLREGVIPAAFLQMKNRGLGCDNRELRELKKQAVDSLLTRSPKDCFAESSENKS